ncbi:hypothetical protein KMZ14_09970 [Acinetobacter schindleri]|uniref:hypothetical protein n=1 Tax=Acinetobacter TaxID=469 RepID=UPI000B3CC9A6|nr:MULTISPECIES: hypothetical protein [Acinetobacter]AZM38527.1 hypothetical protein EJP75_08210 [Acinetobacter baumannii]WDE15085.1 hypothetical protein KMZ14_09970 [Acinetobacter schindleri]HAV6204114.1 hypothetical protein [Acinetobacter baumannii]
MKKYSHDKELNKYIRQLIKDGIASFKPGKKHDFLLVNQIQKITIPGTPSDRKAYLNFKTDIRRALQCQRIPFQQL